MKKLICLSGISGVGKTYRRTTDPKLKDLPYVDIADIYCDNPGIDAGQAFVMMYNEAMMLLEEHDTVVLEAWFRSGSRQRQFIEHYAPDNYEVQYIELDAPVEVCVQRIVEQYETEKNAADPVSLERLSRYHEARLSLLRSVG